ncbi:MAG: ComF family protein [Clostridiales bacterium]|nr:ComF family protein [Clostridiales bacterium]
MNNRTKVFQKVTKGFFELLYPSYANCLACEEKRLENRVDGLCNRCRETLTKEYKKDGFLVLSQIDGCFFPFDYQGINQKLILQLKFGQIQAAALPLAQAMIWRIEQQEENFEGILPIPLYKKRKQQRGFNQAEILAKKISEATGIVLIEGIRRIKNTSAQTKLNKTQRKENVENAFEIIKKEAIQGKTLLLLDDVVTTGATAMACAKVLKEGGAGKVFLLSVAHAPLREKQAEKNE